MRLDQGETDDVYLNSAGHVRLEVALAQVETLPYLLGEVSVRTPQSVQILSSTDSISTEMTLCGDITNSAATSSILQRKRPGRKTDACSRTTKT